MSNGYKFLTLLLRDSDQITALNEELNANVCMLNLFQLRVKFRVQALCVKSVKTKPVFFCDYFVRLICNYVKQLCKLFICIFDHD